MTRPPPKPGDVMFVRVRVTDRDPVHPWGGVPCQAIRRDGTTHDDDGVIALSPVHMFTKAELLSAYGLQQQK